jgi:hypothetical protein
VQLTSWSKLPKPPLLSVSSVLRRLIKLGILLAQIGMSANKPGFYGKFIILTNGVYKETGFLDLSSVSPDKTSEDKLLSIGRLKKTHLYCNCDRLDPESGL